MHDTHQNPNRIAAFENCGARAHVERTAEGDDVRLVCLRCHDRFCAACNAAKAKAIRTNIESLVKNQVVRFLTLTLRHSPTPLADQIDRLYDAFRRFRERASWKTNVSAGVAVLELKVSEFDGLWHPHLHCIITGQWWDAREISREWHAVTGDSSIVKILACDDEAHLNGYVTKYITKPLHPSVLNNPEKLREAMNAMYRRRLLTTFGLWRGVPLLDSPPDDRTWLFVAKLDDLLERAEYGDPTALRWLDALHRKRQQQGTADAPAPIAGSLDFADSG